LHTQTKFRLLVVRLGAMGDILHALHAVTALRQMHPGWIIDWVVEPRWKALLAAEGSCAGHPLSSGALVDSAQISAPKSPSLNSWSEARPARPLNLARPVVDRLYAAATRDWRDRPFSSQTIDEIRNLRRTLREGDYDTVVDLQGALRSAVLGKMSGCQRLVGEMNPRESPARWLFTERVKTAGEHVIEQGVELAAAVAGDDLKPVAPWLPVDLAAEAWVENILPAAESARAVLINPGAGWGAKRWPAERYATVARGLIERGWRVMVNAGPGEEGLAERIVAASGGATALSCTLEQLIALARRVRLAIAGDTGPLHLACALGRPVVGIYGPTDPRRNGPYGTRFRVLRSPQSRRDHTRHESPEAGLMTIEPEDVLQATDELVSGENGE
jgi:heptosyltransferase-1